MINYELGFLIGLLAFVYTYLLTEPNAIFHGLYMWLYKFFKTQEREDEGRPIHPLFMVLIHCEKCFAGQSAFWIYVFSNFYNYNFLQHIFFTAYAIFIAAIIKALYTNKINK